MRRALLRCSFRLSLLVFACGCSNSTDNTWHSLPPVLGGSGGTASGTGGNAGTALGSSGTAGSPDTTAGAGGTSAGTVGTGGTSAGRGGRGAGGTAGGTGGAGGATTAGTAGVGGAVPTTGTGCKGATVCYDFEECATPAGWTVPNYPTDPGEGNQGAGGLLVDNVMPHGGSKCSLHMKDFSGDQPQHALLADLPQGFGPVLWGRAWMFNTGAPTQHGALIKTRYAIPNSPDVDWYEVGYEKQNYDGIWHSPLPPSGLPEWVLQSNTSIVINAWTCVEWLFDTQNSAGTEAADPRIWQDGAEVTFKPGFEYDLSGVQGKPRPPTPKGADFVGIEVGLTMYHAIDMNMNFYMDDLALGKERIGCAD